MKKGKEGNGICQKTFHERRNNGCAGIDRRLTTGEAALDTRATQEPTASDETEEGHHGVGPKEGLEETCRTLGRGILEDCQQEFM